MTDGEWSVVYYTTAQGESPVEAFLDSLDPKTQGRFVWSIEQLRVRNVHAREPLVRHLEGKIWELREESSTNIYRLLYFFYSGRTIVFLHGLQKKTPKTPQKDILQAHHRLDDFLARAGGGESS